MFDTNSYEKKIVTMYSNKTTLKVLAENGIANVKHGETITLDSDNNGIPLDKFWRRRLADSKIDGCVEVVKPSAKKPKSKTTEKAPETLIDKDSE